MERRTFNVLKVFIFHLKSLLQEPVAFQFKTYRHMCEPQTLMDFLFTSLWSATNYILLFFMMQNGHKIFTLHPFTRTNLVIKLHDGICNSFTRGMMRSNEAIHKKFNGDCNEILELKWTVNGWAIEWIWWFNFTITLLLIRCKIDWKPINAMKEIKGLNRIEGMC